MTEAVLDANVLLRYLTNEPRELAERASAILELARSRRTTLLVTSLTLAEIVFVLESVYAWPRETIAERLIELISAAVLTFPEEPILLQALTWYRDTRSLHFADAYVAATATTRGHAAVISFDRALRRLTELTVVQHVDDLD